MNKEIIEAIAEALKNTGVVIKNSTVYAKTVVIGHQDAPCCLMVSDLSDEDNKGHFSLIHFENHNYEIVTRMNGVCPIDGDPFYAEGLDDLISKIKSRLK